MIRLLLTALLPGLVLAGCAAAYAPKAMTEEPTPPQVHRESADLQQALHQADEVLGASLQATAQPDCDRACELGATVCKLSERICTIAGRHPADSELAERCQDGQKRCDRAKHRLTDRCECTGPSGADG